MKSGYQWEEIREEVGVSFGWDSVARREGFSSTSIPESGLVSSEVVNWCAVGTLGAPDAVSSVNKAFRRSKGNFLFECL